MLKIAKLAGAAALALAASFGAHATTFSLTGADFGTWKSFDVDSAVRPLFSNVWVDAHTEADSRYKGNGTALTFTFTLADAAYLKVVDSGLNGDVFAVTDNGSALGTTSAPSNPGTDFLGSTDVDLNSAFANPNFSSATFLLQAGSHSITGLVVSGTSPLDPDYSTVGAIMLTPVPEPETYGLLLAGLAVIGAIARRRT